MRNGFLGSLAAWTAGAAVAWGQGTALREFPMWPAETAPPPQIAPAPLPTAVTAPPRLTAVPDPTGGAMRPASADVPMPSMPMPGPPMGGPPPGMGFDGPPPGMPPIGPMPGWDPSMGMPPGPPMPADLPCPAACFYVNADYLLWWSRRGPDNFPLVVTGPTGAGGLLSNPATSVLVGNDAFDYKTISGVRVSTGFWCGDDRRLGFELGGFLLEQRSVLFNVGSSMGGLPLLARPFIDATTSLPGAVIIASPGSATVPISAIAAGSAVVRSRTFPWSAETSTLLNVYRATDDHSWVRKFNLLGGFRYFNLDEQLDVASTSTVPAGGSIPFSGTAITTPATINIDDRFEVRNNFYGGQLGFQAEVRHGCWSLDLIGKVAAGDMHQFIRIRGNSTLVQANPDPTMPPLVSTTQGGVLAVNTNIGTFQRDIFAVIPEGTVQIGYQLTSHLKATVGYNFLWVSRVVRPGNQIDPLVNPTLIPTLTSFGGVSTVARPVVPFVNSDYWLQGMNFGLNLAF